MPAHFNRIQGLVARVKDALNFPAKKGKIPSNFYSFFWPSPSLSLAAISAANLRPEKIKKTKASVRLLIFLLHFWDFKLISFIIIQGKRPHLSKEFIDSEDDIADFLDSPTVAPKVVTNSKVPLIIEEKVCLFHQFYSVSVR